MRLLMLFVFSVFLTTALPAQEFCSLVVKAVYPGGSELIDNSPVTVEEGDGRIVEKRYDFGGVRFCDLGIGPVTITVGRRGCAQVVVRDVPPVWGRTTTVTVIVNHHACEVYGLEYGIMGCPVVYRFRDSQKRDIKGVSLMLHSPFQRIFEADEFGRVYVLGVRYNSELTGTATANGYDLVNVKLTCTGSYRRADQFITMNETR